VENFLSFNDVQEFSMTAGKTRTNSDRLYDDKSLKLIKFAAIYGANASGKSNLIKAIDFARYVIVNKIPGNSLGLYSKVSKENITKSSSFEFEIEVNGKYYAYGFKILLDEQLLKAEWLYEINKTGKDKEIFTRDIEKGEYSINKYIKGKKILAKLQVFIDVVKNDGAILFLQDLNKNKKELYKESSELNIFKDIYNWFDKKLDVNYANRPLRNTQIDIFDENVSSKIEQYLKAFGTGICKVSTEEVSREFIKKKLPDFIIEDIIKRLKEELKKNIGEKKLLLNAKGEGFFLFQIKDDESITYKILKFNHNEDDITFLLSEESDGTQRLMELLSVLLNDEEGKVFIIDELDRCLHPLLSKKFVSTFLEIATKKNIQLIITTHESQLMDLNLLRKDEIWLLNKNNQGGTTIYPLDEYNERFDKKIVKAYLEGRYGGIPEFYDDLLYKESCEDF
jgi:AAA15 family ATPase/GTPase